MTNETQGTDIAERIRARERTAHAEPTEVPERMASLFVYVEPLTGPDKGNGDVKWYLEGDRGLVAESVARLVRDGEPLLVLTGRKGDYGVVRERREAVAALAAVDLGRARDEVELLWRDPEVRIAVQDDVAGFLSSLRAFSLRLVGISREAEFGRAYRRVLKAEADEEKQVTTEEG